MKYVPGTRLTGMILAEEDIKQQGREKKGTEETTNTICIMHPGLHSKAFSSHLFLFSSTKGNNNRRVA